jgi:flagellar biosynthesis/type III secretory pathway chaperone
MEWFKKLNIKFKIALGLLGLFLGMFLFMTVRRKFTAKSKLNYELAQKTHEIELAHLEKDEEIKKTQLEELEKEKSKIIRQLDVIEAQEIEIGREMSVEELNDFFNERGF